MGVYAQTHMHMGLGKAGSAYDGQRLALSVFLCCSSYFETVCHGAWNTLAD